MTKALTIRFMKGGHADEREVAIAPVIVAGWTGRDEAAVRKHVKELEELGVRAPSATPVFYRVSSQRLTTSKSIEVVGEHSSGEVEFVLLQSGGELWVGLGSDHTDRAVEAYDVAISKEVCEKPIAAAFWSFAEVEKHWDQLTLRSFIVEDNKRVPYQECAVTTMLAPRVLIERFVGYPDLPEGALMYCGTSPAIGGIRPAPEFQGELHDPVLGRTIAFRYAIHTLPQVS